MVIDTRVQSWYCMCVQTKPRYRYQSGSRNSSNDVDDGGGGGDIT